MKHTGTPKVLILAGGFGTRLAKVVNDRPKPLVLIQGKPFLQYLIEFLKTQDFHDFVLLTGHMSEQIEQHFGDGRKLDVRIGYSVEHEPLGTGGAIRQAMEQELGARAGQVVAEAPSHARADKAAGDNPARAPGRFVVVNGDSLFVTDYRQFLQSARGPCSLALKFVDDVSRYGAVEVNSAHAIVNFREKSANIQGGGLINAGVYYLESSILPLMPRDGAHPRRKFSMETDVFQPLAANAVLTGIRCDGDFIDIGTPESYHWAQNHGLPAK